MLPVIASNRGRKRGGPEVTGPSTGDKKTRETGGKQNRRCVKARRKKEMELLKRTSKK